MNFSCLQFEHILFDVQSQQKMKLGLQNMLNYNGKSVLLSGVSQTQQNLIDVIIFV